jgi:hypothetical protein
LLWVLRTCCWCSGVLAGPWVSAQLVRRRSLIHPHMHACSDKRHARDFLLPAAEPGKQRMRFPNAVAVSAADTAALPAAATRDSDLSNGGYSSTAAVYGCCAVRCICSPSAVPRQLLPTCCVCRCICCICACLQRLELLLSGYGFLFSLLQRCTCFITPSAAASAGLSQPLLGM